MKKANSNEKIIRELKGNTIGINQLTKRKTLPINLEKNPFGPFRGIDGKTYVARQCTVGINCYAYALGLNLRVKTESGVYTPGFLNGMVRYDDPIIESVKSDLTWLGRQIYEIYEEIPDKLPKEAKGTYYIKCLRAKGSEGLQGIHFMVKDPKSGRWIHKLGWEARPKVVVEYEFESTKERVMKEIQKKNPLLSTKMLEMMVDFAVSESPYSESYIAVKVEYPEKDNGGYISYDGKGLVEYVPLFAMRIS